MNMGMPTQSWYDITGIDERSNENCPGLDESSTTIVSILQKEHASNSLPYNRMVLAGFSQGGALSLFAGLQMEVASEKLAGVVCLSGYLPCSKKFSITKGLENTPIFHGHGINDSLVTYEMAEKTKTVLLEKGAKNYELKGYAGLHHSLNEQEILDVLKFFEKILPADDSCKIKLKDPGEMSVKELKAAIRKVGLGREAVGFMEKSEFVALLRRYREGK